MSCVVGLIYDKAIYMASDGIATTEDGEKRPIQAVKIFRNGDYLFGYSGSVRAGQVMFSQHFKPPDDIDKLVDEMREHMSVKGVMIIADTQVQMCNANFLIGYKGKLFEVLMDFQINEIEGDYTAIGSGAQLALGSLHSSTDMMMTPRERVVMAVEAACEYDMSCGLPITVEVI